MRFPSIVAVILLVAATGCRPSSDAGGASDAVAPSRPLPSPEIPTEARVALPTYTAARVDPAAITIDGRFDEPAWQSAADTGPLVAPGNGAYIPHAEVNGHARLLWSDAGLYLAFVVDDRGAESEFERDAVDPHVWESASGVELMLQPGDPGDNTHYYEIQVGVAGEVWDTRFDDYNRPIVGTGPRTRYGHEDWSASLQRGVTHEADFYAVEMLLPWSAIESERAAVPPAAGDSWRMNLYTFRDGQQAALAWSPLLGQGNFHRASRFGHLVFGE